MQQDTILLGHEGQKLRPDIQVIGGPDLGEANSLVPLEIGPGRRKKKVRIKLIDEERRNLRITVFRSEFGRGF